jgi:flavin-dependent dehydrogenase
MIQTDICVLGAGPGGVAAALKLAKLGIPCTLIDKAIFPRDKICGDAISGKVVYAFNRIDKDIFKNFQENNTLRFLRYFSKNHF